MSFDLKIEEASNIQRRLPSMPSTAGTPSGRFWHQCQDERWRSWSTSAVFLPAFAKCAARCVAIVVLPQPPFELATRILRMAASAGKCGDCRPEPCRSRAAAV